MKFIPYAIFSFLLLFSVYSKAQSGFSVKGSVADTTAASKLQNASALVLRAKDSIMVKFTRADQEGKFAFNNLPEGKYLILITYPEYADYSEPFTLGPATPAHDFGRINMLLKARILQDIVIKATPTAIKIKGDTTVFNASAYVVQPNAKVEDLIKQFPGIQVDKDGKVTANGQTVSKFLVDGEEFFGDDPTLVTKNLRADMVKEIQMYDKKSDQATFTGIDDGQKTRTMNVVLKEDKKNGYFGKLYGGIGNNDFYTGQLGFNKFQGKEKIAIYGIAANTGKTSLGADDAQKFGDGGNVTVMDGGGIMISGGGNDLYYDGRGIPNALSGGLHYDNKWNKDKHSLNTNYKIGQVDVDGTSNTLTQNNLPNAFNTTISDQRFNRSAFRQKLDATYLVNIDTSSTLKVIVDGTLRGSKSNTDNVETTTTDIGYTGVSNPLNYQTRSNTVETDQRQMNASGLYTKKLKKKGRTYSILFSNAIDNVTRDEFLKAKTEYYNGATGVLDSTRVIDQYKPGTSKTNVFNSNFTYSEPLSKYLSMVVNYGVNVSNGDASSLTLERTSPNADYDRRVDSLSNVFSLNQLAHQAGAILNYVKGKTTLNFGTRLSDVQYKQINEFTDKAYERHFINWMPQLTYQYRMGTQASFRLNYNGSTTQPSMTQLQPIRNNTDPLNQTIGNPDLKPAFSNRFNAYYSSYKALSGQELYVSANYSFTTSQIVSNNVTGKSGGSITQFVNTDQTPYNYSFTVGASRKIVGVNVSLRGSVSQSVSYNMVNNVLNSTKTASYSPNLSINKYEAKKYEIYLSGGPSYNVTELSVQKNMNSNGYGVNAYAFFTWYLPGGFQINSDVDYMYTGKTQTFDQSISRALWNATVSKTFMKDNSLKLTATLNDMLNQNTGFNRSANGGRISQNTYTTIRRFFMLAVTWDFSKMGAAAKQ